MDKKTNKGYAEGGYKVINSLDPAGIVSQSFAFMAPREKIDMSKVTLEVSEGPSWYGTVDNLNEYLSSERRDYLKANGETLDAMEEARSNKTTPVKFEDF